MWRPSGPATQPSPEITRKSCELVAGCVPISPSGSSVRQVSWILPSPAAMRVASNPLLPKLPMFFSLRSNWKISMGLLLRVSVRRAKRGCAVIISHDGVPCRHKSRDDARANRAPESFIHGLVFTLKGLTLAR